MDRSLWTASLFLVILGLLSLAGGVVSRIYQHYREAGRGRVTARVVDLVLKESDGADSRFSYKNCYYPGFEYYAGGKLYKIVHPKGSYPSAFHVNQAVKLTYDREDPANYEIARNNIWGTLSAALYGAGVACLCGAFLLFISFAQR